MDTIIAVSLYVLRSLTCVKHDMIRNLRALSFLNKESGTLTPGRLDALRVG